MWQIWKAFEPRRALIGLGVFLAALAFTIHFILLSTERYNWLVIPQASATEEVMVVNPPGRTARSQPTIVG